MADNLAHLTELARLVDDLEARASGPVELDHVARTCGDALVESAVHDALLLVDFRQRLDTATGALMPVTLCRLNRHHPAARALGDD